MSYHYGKTIREYRIANKMTLEQLASKWPSKEAGISIRYVIDVEAGKKQITDVEKLRKLASILNIPLYKLGLSEYNPFNEDDAYTHFIDTNILLEFIQDIWYLRLNMPIDITEKKIISLSNIFDNLLARGYATFGDEKRFIQAINTSILLADNMRNIPVVTKDYVFHAYSAILEEKSNGFILLGKGKEAIAELQEIDMQIAKENNTYLKMWMPLDYAQSFMLMDEIETSIKWLEAFYSNIRSYDSVRIHSTVKKHLDQLDNLGYANLPVVKNFKMMSFETNHNSARE